MLNRKNSFLLRGDIKVCGKGMQILSQIINNIYVPLETKHADTKMNLQKFVAQINQSSQQIIGTINIVIPEAQDDLSDSDAINNKALMEKYESYLERWTNTIKTIIVKETNKKPDPNSALAEIEYWRNRSATLSNLHQQLSNPFVAVVKRVNFFIILLFSIYFNIFLFFFTTKKIKFFIFFIFLIKYFIFFIFYFFHNNGFPLAIGQISH